MSPIGRHLAAVSWFLHAQPELDTRLCRVTWRLLFGCLNFHTSFSSAEFLFSLEIEIALIRLFLILYYIFSSLHDPLFLPWTGPQWVILPVFNHPFFGEKKARQSHCRDDRIFFYKDLPDTCQQDWVSFSSLTHSEEHPHEAELAFGPLSNLALTKPHFLKSWTHSSGWHVTVLADYKVHFISHRNCTPGSFLKRYLFAF